MSEHNPLRAALYVLTSALLFALMGALIKYLSTRMPYEMVVFSRNLFGLLALLPWLLRKGLGSLRSTHLHLHLLRGLFGLSAMYCFFYALGRLPLADAVLLNYTAPLYIPAIAWLWLKEPTAPSLRWALLLGFAGIMLILKPGSGLFQPVALIGAAAGLLTAGAFVTLRRMSATEPASRTVFYFALMATLISLLPLGWAWETPPASLWLVLVGMGGIATTAQLLLTRGYAYAPAAQVGPLTYTIVLFSALLGWWLWDEVPDALSLGGGALVIAAWVMALRLRSRPSTLDR